MVFQRPVVLRRSVEANLHHALKTYGVPRRERARRIEELLELGQLQALTWMIVAHNEKNNEDEHS